jgi:hypothetical protein
LSAVRYAVDNQPVFPDVYAKSRKWFHRVAGLFRRPRPDETIFQKFHAFTSMQLMARFAPEPRENKQQTLAHVAIDHCDVATPNSRRVGGRHRIEMPSTATD